MSTDDRIAPQTMAWAGTPRGESRREDGGHQAVQRHGHRNLTRDQHPSVQRAETGDRRADRDDRRRAARRQSSGRHRRTAPVDCFSAAASIRLITPTVLDDVDDGRQQRADDRRARHRASRRSRCSPAGIVAHSRPRNANNVSVVDGQQSAREAPVCRRGIVNRDASKKNEAGDADRDERQHLQDGRDDLEAAGGADAEPD